MRAVARAPTEVSEPTGKRSATPFRFTALPRGSPLVPGVLSLVLHAALIGALFYGLDLRFHARADSGRAAGVPVLYSDWVPANAIHELARSETDASRVTTRAPPVQPPRIVVDPVPLPDIGEPAPGKTDLPAAPDKRSLAAEADEGGALELQPVPTLAPELDIRISSAPPIDRRVDVAPELQVQLMQRLSRAATDLHKSGRTEVNWEHDGQPFRAVLTRDPGAAPTDLERVRVDVTTESPRGTSLKTQLTLKRLAYSHFSQIVDRWDPMVEMHHDEVIGRFHSNSPFLVSPDRRATPRISGTASTAAAGLGRAPQRPRSPRLDAFEGGFQTRAERIDLPRRAPRPDPAKIDPEAYVRQFDYDTRITFHRDGRYTWEAVGTGISREETYPRDRPAFLIGAPGVILRVKGIVSGTVLVYASWGIVIEGSLRYDVDPRESTESEDYLGLVADNFVQIARPEVTGPGDLQIDAAIFARKEFVVRDINAPPTGTLSIYGSLTSGTMSATEPRYATRIEFDPRLARIRLPSFPATDRYELEQWDAAWTEESAAPAGVAAVAAPPEPIPYADPWVIPPP